MAATVSSSAVLTTVTANVWSVSNRLSFAQMVILNRNKPMLNKQLLTSSYDNIRRREYEDIYLQIRRRDDRFKKRISRNSLHTKAVGCIYYCPRTNRTLVVQQTNNIFSFPKGQREQGEKLMETATRESVEETGIRPDLTACKVRYFCQAATEQTVYYLLELDSEPIPDKVVNNEEISLFKWVDINYVSELRPRGYNKQLLEVCSHLSRRIAKLGTINKPVKSLTTTQQADNSTTTSQVDTAAATLIPQQLDAEINVAVSTHPTTQPMTMICAKL